MHSVDSSDESMLGGCWVVGSRLDRQYAAPLPRGGLLRLCAPGGLGHSEKVAAEDSVDVGVGPAGFTA